MMTEHAIFVTILLAGSQGLRATKGRRVVRALGTVRLRVEEIATTPILAPDRMGSCEGLCDEHYEAALPLTDAWTEHAYTWRQLVQPFGTPATFDPKTLLGLNFEFNAGTTYDLWLDNIEFTK